jgi:hypothetical protein
MKSLPERGRLGGAPTRVTTRDATTQFDGRRAALAATGHRRRSGRQGGARALRSDLTRRSLIGLRASIANASRAGRLA